MGSLMRLLTFILMLAMIPAGIAHADVSYSSAGTVYGQNFNGLASTTVGNPYTWSNNSTIADWYSTQSTYLAGTGSDNNGSLYSFGIAGVNPVTDRGLGSLTSSSATPIRTGIAFVNNTGTTLNTISIRYTGEQWRRASQASTDSLTFDYKLSASPITINDLTGFVSHAALNFTSPVVGTGGATSLDGNAAANRVNGINVQLGGFSWLSGQTLFLRWTDLDIGGSDHGLAIDDFYLAASVPEPGSIALLAGLGIVGSFVARRRMAAKRTRV